MVVPNMEDHGQDWNQSFPLLDISLSQAAAPRRPVQLGRPYHQLTTTGIALRVVKAHKLHNRLEISLVEIFSL